MPSFPSLMVQRYNKIEKQRDFKAPQALSGDTELVSPGVKMQVVDRISSLLPAEKTLMSQIVMDLETGNHLLGRPRSKEYWDFSAEHGGAVRALKEGAKLTDRQRDILLERAYNYHGGIAELAAMLNMDEQKLRKALVYDAVKEHRIEQNFHVFEDGLFVYVDARHGFGLSPDFVEQVAQAHYGERTERDGRLMYRFPSRDDASNFVHNIGILNERYTNVLRDSLINKMRRAGIDVNTDWQEGERVLAQENGRNMNEHFAESKEEFDIIREIVAKEKGVVTPGLAEMDFSVVPVKLHDFTSEKPIEEGLAWAKENLVTTKKDLERGELPKMKDGEPYTISTNAITKFLSEKAVGKSDNVHIHLSVLKVLKEVIGESIDSELRPDYPKDENDNRLPLKYNKNGLIHILYGAVNIDNNIYRVKTTMQEFRGNETSKPHSYEAIKIELLDSPMAASFIRSVNVGQNESDTKEFTRISISGAKVQQNSETTKDLAKKELPPSNYRTRT